MLEGSTPSSQSFTSSNIIYEGAANRLLHLTNVARRLLKHALCDREKKQLGPGCLPIHAHQSFKLEGQGFHGGQGGQYAAPRIMWP